MVAQSTKTTRKGALRVVSSVNHVAKETMRVPKGDKRALIIDGWSDEMTDETLSAKPSIFLFVPRHPIAISRARIGK